MIISMELKYNSSSEIPNREHIKWGYGWQWWWMVGMFDRSNWHSLGKPHGSCSSCSGSSSSNSRVNSSSTRTRTEQSVIVGAAVVGGVGRASWMVWRVQLLGVRRQKTSATTIIISRSNVQTHPHKHTHIQSLAGTRVKSSFGWEMVFK